MIRQAYIVSIILQLYTFLEAAPFDIDDKLFELSIVHLNDFHARFEEISPQSTVCKPEMEDCLGGFARVYTEVHKLLKERNNAIFLNAGDNFQGTLWYNVHRWNVTQYFLNMLPTDAITLGNHEFDHKIKGVVPFMKAMKAPFIVANMDSSKEPNIQGLYNSSIIINRGGKRIGIVGVVSKDYPNLTSSEKLIFTDETEAVRQESKKLKEDQKCDIVIVLSHSGIETDRIIAKEGGPYLDLIVGGHSHTFLYNGTDLPGPDIPEDEYPVVVKQNETKTVLIVQAAAFTKYLGDLTVWFDENNTIVGWKGNPIYLNASVPQDPHILELLEPWKEAVDALGNITIGTTKVVLDQSNCRMGECSLGSFLTDSMVDAWVDESEEEEWGYVQIGLINPGGIRTGIEIGDITNNDLITAQPFENTLDAFELRGDHLLEALEYGVSDTKTKLAYMPLRLLQVSGIQVTYNTSQAAGSRVQEVLVRCLKCVVPKYELLDLKQYYRIATVSYIANGGDGFTMISNNKRNHRVGPLDVDAISRYIKKQSPIISGIDGRLKMLN